MCCSECGRMDLQIGSDGQAAWTAGRRGLRTLQAMTTSSLARLMGTHVRQASAWLDGDFCMNWCADGAEEILAYVSQLALYQLSTSSCALCRDTVRQCGTNLISSWESAMYNAAEEYQCRR